MDDSLTDSSLISRLENSNYTNVRQDFLKHLNPFSNFLSRKKTLKKKKENEDKIRLLGIQFLPFLKLTIKLLPDLLISLQKSSERGNKEDIASELFDVYEFCLECLSLIFASNEVQMVSINVQKVRLLRCYAIWRRFIDAEIQGFRILSSLRRPVTVNNLSIKKKKKIEEEFFLPDVLLGEKENPDLALVVVDTVICLIKCSYNIQRKDDAVHQRVLLLVDQVRPWFRVLDSKSFERAHYNFLSNLYNCALFMLRSDSCLDENLVCKFCMTTLIEYSNSSQKDQFFKITYGICLALQFQWNSRSSLIVDILKYSCRDVGQNLGEMASTFFEVLVPSDSILRLYAAGLCFTESSFQRTCIESESSLVELLITPSFRCWDDRMTDVVHSLASYFHVASNNCCSLKCSLSCTSEHGRISFLSYLNALAFFCAPVAKLIYNAREYVLTGKISEMLSPKIFCILNACQQLCEAFLHHFSCTSESDKAFSSEFEGTLCYAAVTALIISFRTDKNVKRSVNHIECIASRWWNRLHLMKSLTVSIHNIGLCLYKTKQMKKASDMLELFCRSSWTCIGNLEARHDDWSEEAITHFVIQACSRSVILLDCLHECGSSDLCRNVKAALIMCKGHAGVDAEGHTPILYSLLCKSLRERKSSTTLTKRTSGIILEQELLAYEELESNNTNLCQIMQLKITEILLRDMYVTEDLQRSKILMKMGRLHRARGIIYLKSCINCLSDAISILSKQTEFSSKISPNSYSNSHQLALAYCWHAIYSDEEPQPNLKVIINNIICALKLWLSIDWSVDDHYELVNENVIQLLCCIADLLSIKGHFHFQDDICKLIIILLKKERVPPEKCFAMLWADRRLTHALCTKPIDENIIASFAQHFGACSDSDTVGIWLRCIKESQTLLVGFHQKFSLYDSILSQVGHCLAGSPMGYNVTVNEIEEIASVLKPGASIDNFNFLAGYLYHDLCERLVLSGRLNEALSFANKGCSLRHELLQTKFICSIGNKPQYIRETEELEVIGSVASEVWPRMNTRKLEECNLSQWNVLRCYLESILQVGSIHEALGNAGIAQSFLMVGKNISSKKRLQIFEVAFTSALGEIFCKKQSWDLAGSELDRAKKILKDKNSLISCRQCKLILEVTIDKQIADLNRRRSDGTKTSLLKSSSAALVMYRKALNKLKQFEWNSGHEHNSMITRSKSRSSYDRESCFGECGKVYEMHEMFWQSISMLFDRKPFCETYLSSHSHLLELFGKERQGDVFAIECASILYNLSWFCLKNIDSRSTCCDLSCIQLSSVVLWLLQAFMLSCEVPLLAQKVSRLLATVFFLSTSGGPFCLPLFPGKAFSASRYAAFFHQASIGSYFNHQLFGPGCIADLEKLILGFFRLLPSTTVICISVFGSDYGSLLRDVLSDHVASPAWVLLSRLNSENEPTVMLLPSDVIPKDMAYDADYITFSKGIDSSKIWDCPWGCTVVDDIAPEFKLILEGNYLSSCPPDGTQEQKLQWWAWRDKLNGRLDKFVRNIEESWFGPWKCLLLGEPCKYEFKANENHLKVILGGASSVSETVECICQMLLQKGGITRWGFSPIKKLDLSSYGSAQLESLSGMLHQLISEANQELEAGCINRLPVILVPDSDVQVSYSFSISCCQNMLILRKITLMLQWENLPVLRKAEVYRMPSVSSIFALIKDHSDRQEQILPSFNGEPPSFKEDSSNIVAKIDEAKPIFTEDKYHKVEIAAKDSLHLDVQYYDFIGIDHILCSPSPRSGSLPFMGCYNPQGVVLSYLLAGSPAIIANLWEVTDKDIDKFGKALVSAWLQEREAFPIVCNSSKLVEDFESMCCIEIICQSSLPHEDMGPFNYNATLYPPDSLVEY
ncbi:hypothetical protein AQUCO_07400019v1 [Aquilegia coerulea]|uniref:Separase n=1 Tax=Aquilegia coerulea TaxID=218851 RepID=A0A2G5C9D5_AQUCA|nr:hypothetical protein AQUCO_07400019v1 [Aquilegia coerulea]